MFDRDTLDNNRLLLVEHMKSMGQYKNQIKMKKMIHERDMLVDSSRMMEMNSMNP